MYTLTITTLRSHRRAYEHEHRRQFAQTEGK